MIMWLSSKMWVTVGEHSDQQPEAEPRLAAIAWNDCGLQETSARADGVYVLMQATCSRRQRGFIDQPRRKMTESPKGVWGLCS